MAALPDLPDVVLGVIDRTSPLAARTTAIIVPTRGAAETLRRTLEHRLLADGGGAVVLPDLLTRDDLYLRLHEQQVEAPPLLTGFEREVLLRRAARAASDQGAAAPFRLRAGLIAAILDFYDQLRRQGRTIAAFDREMTDALVDNVETDRGAERLMRQTRFLTSALSEFERAVAASGRIDEHALRARVLDRDRPIGYRHLIVTVADQAADRHGLWPVDYDLIARCAGLARIDVIATERVTRSGFGERLREVLPGIDELPVVDGSPGPVLLVPEPPPLETGTHWFISRDREEELADAVRALTHAPAGMRAGIVYQRPLPYLYLARHLLPDAGVAYQALDSLPLAAEPFAAAIDLVFEAALSEGTRQSLTDLLRSPLWRFTADGPLSGRDVAALDTVLLEHKYLGGWGRFRELVDRSPWTAGRRPSRVPPRVLEAAQTALDAVHAIVEAPTAPQQYRRLLELVRTYEAAPPPAVDDGGVASSRHARAREAILGAVASLADAHAVHDDQPLLPTDLVAAVRRWIEGQTFAPSTGASGLALLDAHAAAYADLDDVRLLGLVERDWPERAPRSIFYPAWLLEPLGWPRESSRLAAARARFGDLLRLPRARIAVSTFTLEDDAVVPPSPFLEDVAESGLRVERVPPPAPTLVFAQEALRTAGVEVEGLDETRSAWMALRAGRTPRAAAAYHGDAGPRTGAPYSVTRLERYLDCPFKYFAAHVLDLDEEKEETTGLTPLERGQFMHEVFEDFFRQWAEEGHGSITADEMDVARAMFARVGEKHLERLREGDRALERTHLLGSAAAPGLAERVFTLEIEEPTGILERQLERAFDDTFEIAGADGAVSVALRGKIDRIDLLDDGTLRIVDYKLTRAPKSSRALQLPVYSVCAEQVLKGARGRKSWSVSQACYVAFKERAPYIPLATRGTTLEQAMAAGQERLVETVAAIERGAFPVDPDEPFKCTWCGYAGVCRKDYVGDE